MADCNGDDPSGRPGRLARDQGPDVGCALNCGTPTSPLFMVNHWLNNFDQLVTDAKEVNTFTVLDARMQACVTERGRRPNFVAVN